VFVAPLEKEFGWKRADTSLIFTIAGSQARAAPAACVDCFRTGRCAGLPDHSVCGASDRKSVEVPDRRQGRLGRLPVTEHASVELRRRSRDQPSDGTELGRASTRSRARCGRRSRP
jgi:hypothetical protein